MGETQTCLQADGRESVEDKKDRWWQDLQDW